jgi:DNA (cytosine-5)-methyltransferase 1
VNTSSFPQDYNFMDQSAHYICGMSVPPNMTANIAAEVYKQWFSK